MTLLRFAASLSLALWGGMVWVRGVAAQTEGAIAGTVRDTAARRPLLGAQVLVDDRIGAVSDSLGRYRVRAVRTGWHRVAARLIGYRGLVLDSVFVRAGATVTADFMLEASAVELAPLVVSAPVDELLDPLATSSEQKISAADLRDLPVSSLEEAIALSAGSVGTSYRGGRVGEESFILDGLGIKNQLDAASGGLGLRIPPDMLGEASLVTNGFSARYGQALSGLVNVVTLDPGERWQGRSAIETDRPFGGGLDHGLDRLAVRADGPITKGGIGLVAAIDVTGRLDDVPVNAPAPDNPLDPPHPAAQPAAPQLGRAVERRRQAGGPALVQHRAAGVRGALRGPAVALRSGVQVRPGLLTGPAAPRRPDQRAPAVPDRGHLELPCRR
jgi:hypothetical protein